MFGPPRGFKPTRMTFLPTELSEVPGFERVPGVVFTVTNICVCVSVCACVHAFVCTDICMYTGAITGSFRLYGRPSE